MTAGLAPSNLIKVTASLAPRAVPLRGFGIPLFLDSAAGVIDIAERLRVYSTIDEVAADWPTSSGAYKAALAFFSQSPQPSKCYIGFWARSATPGIMHGGLLTPSQKLLSNFTAINAGAFSGTIDGVPFTITGLNFSDVQNLNAVAAILQTAVRVISPGATVLWNAALGRFDFTSGTTGLTSTFSFGKAPRAFGFANFSGQPSANDTITVCGTAVTFVTSGATGNQVNIGADLAATLAGLTALINPSSDTNLSKVTANVVGSKVYFTADLAGTAGNAYTLAKSSSAITLSGATLSGGSGTDCSATLGIQSTQGGSETQGALAEAPLDALIAFADRSNDWYAAAFADTTPIADADLIACAEFIEAASPDRIFLITTQDTATLNPSNSSDIASQVKSLNLSRTLVQYSSSSLYAAVSLFGRNATVDYAANNTVINLMWKIEPGIKAETLTETQAAALKAKNCNTFVNYNNGTAIIQWGTMANGDYVDERIGIDWLKNFIQTTLWNVLYQTPTKVPQTDAGTQLLVTPTKGCCQQAVNNGLLAPGKWTGPNIGQIATGDILPLGYYVFADIVANQSQSDREARKAVPIQVAAKFAGAVNTVDVLMTFNR